MLVFFNKRQLIDRFRNALEADWGRGGGRIVQGRKT